MILVVVGPPVVGKSALTIRLTQSEFANEYDPTIEDSYRHYCDIDSNPVSLDILDTAGQEEYSSMRDLYMKTGEGFLLVFSLTDRNTFEEISNFYNQIMRVKGETTSFVPSILVGNKSDLIDERQVGKEEAINLAKQIGSAYIETSAKSGVNVTEAFYNLVRMIVKGSINGSGLENTIVPDPNSPSNKLVTSSSSANNKNYSNNNTNSNTFNGVNKNNNNSNINSNSLNINNINDNINGNNFNNNNNNTYTNNINSSATQNNLNNNNNSSTLQNNSNSNGNVKNSAKSSAGTSNGRTTNNKSQNANEKSGGCCIIV
ncbi:unnamed protein product [[Candida] boidinii]|uniref:Unnamed protein product n=1 Tax=Candida boidinii TaxID=5477 RepID=A0A9W6WIL5_CANBO|nr:unnamed protein product [[Candida] boidinii]GMF99382.1 unnamed protein product [[Candida] boidinii]